MSLEVARTGNVLNFLPTILDICFFSKNMLSKCLGKCYKKLSYSNSLNSQECPCIMIISNFLFFYHVFLFFKCRTICVTSNVSSYLLRNSTFLTLILDCSCIIQSESSKSNNSFGSYKFRNFQTNTYVHFVLLCFAVHINALVMLIKFQNLKPWFIKRLKEWNMCTCQYHIELNEFKHGLNVLWVGKHVHDSHYDAPLNSS
jgi:hypothetical protein